MTLFKNFEGVLDPHSAEADLINSLEPQKLPRHIAIIMDGNGRWAKKRKLPRVAGHRAGIDSVRATVETSARLGIPVLTLYAFSAENWKRPAGEVNTLMNLLKEYLRRELHTLQENKIRFQCIGRIRELPESVQYELQFTEEATRTNKGMKLVIALNYSGRLELVDALNKLLQKGVGYPVSDEDIEQNLYTAGLPEPDLLIRTSGEMRISNFLLWQIAYAEIYVTDTLWPDFRGMHLLEAIRDFQKRERRYGGIRPITLHNTR
ncbi:MAG: isoprenyl transferase [Acidobacteria bacterium]|nr:isoprenyl transferase [Acidobacteriota bacterium]